MTWLFFAISAYFINAVNAVIDKFLLGSQSEEAGLVRGGKIPEPIVYSFYVGLLSIFALMFAPFGLTWPGWWQLAISLMVGAVLLGALIAYFVVVKRSEASRVVPIIGGFTPIFVFVLSYILLGERLSLPQLIAFPLLVIGGVLISIQRKKERAPSFTNYSLEVFGLSVLSAFFFALFFVGMKLVFSYQNFISGFVWTRMGSFFAAVLLLVPTKNRQLIFASSRNLEIKTGALFIFNKALAGLAFLTQNYAIKLGSVILVNAVQGTQYVFLLGLTTLLSLKMPQILDEKIAPLILLQKMLAIFLIGVGLLILALY